MKRSLAFVLALLVSVPPLGSAEEPTPSSSTIPAQTDSTDAVVPPEESTPPASHLTPSNAPSVVRGIHLTAAAAGSRKYREKLDRLFNETLINCVVIDLKDEGGEVHVPGVKMVERTGAYRRTIPDLAEWVASLKKRGIYTVGRIVVFKDNILPRKIPGAGVRNPNGDLWFDRKKITWADPYSQEAWRYNLLISLEAAKLGIEEIQYDYIRFPTDGMLSQMRFSKPYSKAAASQALVSFLGQARQLLHPLGAKLSIDVFGLTTTDQTGMGIGQLLRPMADQVDFVCPMTYPSHYAKGEYGLANPNDQPYKVIAFAMRDAQKVLGPEGAHKLRPYLQDFSLKGRGIPYRAKEVRAQIQAAADLGVMSWTLWNASCQYSWEALKEPVVAVPFVSTTTPLAPRPSKAKEASLPSENPPK